METEGSRDESETDSKDRLPQQSSLHAHTPSPPSMSVAVAPADLKNRGASSSSGSLVMNPLVASLSRHTSLHAFPESQEPAPKKRKLVESDSAAISGSTSNSKGDLSPATVSGNSSSCDSVPLRVSSSLRAISAGNNVNAEEKLCNEEKRTGKGVHTGPSLEGEQDKAKPVAIATSPTIATNTATATQKQSATQTASAATVPPNASDLASQAQESCPPQKSTKMSHLHQKYFGELEYMLREFEKLERQLLGARKTEESKASKERREKLHSFIQHLTETIQQIERGCQLEAVGQPILSAISDMPTEPLSASSQQNEEEENVRKLEDHILVNLLPVKVRLKKQLAAQQGAKHNPATMPHRGAHTLASETTATGSTFADAAKRQYEAAIARQEAIAVPPPPPVAPDQTQFGKPLVKGSSLTKKLHGPTLGSSQRAHGDGVGAPEKATKTTEKKRYIGGLAVGSSQMESSLDAASNVHQLVIQEPALLLKSQAALHEDDIALKPAAVAETVDAAQEVSLDTRDKTTATSTTVATVQSSTSSVDPDTEERRRKLRQKKRKKFRLREQAKAAEQRELEQGRKKQKAAKKSQRGPRHVEYMCALCNEVYNSTCEYNPWWALSQHDCPKCRKRQIPRIDIGAPANAIEYHPALLAHADENGGGVVTPEHGAPTEITEVSSPGGELSDEDSLAASDISSDCGDISTDEDCESWDSDSEGLSGLSPADHAERERFGSEYMGPTFTDREASRLLILMGHASTCPCQHKSHEHRDTCRSVKWMMLHVRDCPGTTSNFDVCPFPWCRKVKHLLYHLVSCLNPESCRICSPADLGRNLVYLQKLNEHRHEKYRKALVSKFCPEIKSKSLSPKQSLSKTQKRLPDKCVSRSPKAQKDDSLSQVARKRLAHTGAKPDPDNAPSAPLSRVIQPSVEDAADSISEPSIRTTADHSGRADFIYSSNSSTNAKPSAKSIEKSGVSDNVLVEADSNGETDSPASNGNDAAGKIKLEDTETDFPSLVESSATSSSATEPVKVQ